MVRAHRQAWCWQDEWYGLTIEDIRQLELETQLALARKMAQYSLGEEASGPVGAAAEANGSSSNSSSSSSHHRHNHHHHHQEGGQEGQEQGAGEAAGAVAQEAEGKAGEEGEARGELTKQWSTSSSNRSSKRGGEFPAHTHTHTHTHARMHTQPNTHTHTLCKVLWVSSKPLCVLFKKTSDLDTHSDRLNLTTHFIGGGGWVSVELTNGFAVSAGSPSHQSISEWRMQSIARDSDDSTDEDEFFDAHGKHTNLGTGRVIIYCYCYNYNWYDES